MFGARDRIAQSAKGVIEYGSHFQRLLLFFRAGPAKAVRMPLAAALVKVLLKFFRIERELRREPQRIVELHRAALRRRKTSRSRSSSWHEDSQTRIPTASASLSNRASFRPETPGSWDR